MRSEGVFLLAVTMLISCLAHAGEYSSLQVVSPEPEETIHDNNGNLIVRAAISPPLRADTGDRLALLLDGNNVASGGGLSYELTGIDRGTHTLQIQVVAAGRHGCCSLARNHLPYVAGIAPFQGAGLNKGSDGTGST